MHRKSADVKVRLPFAVASVARANLLEETEAELEVTDGVVSIHLDACEIVTVILRR
jgi:hypothetical protein